MKSRDIASEGWTSLGGARLSPSGALVTDILSPARPRKGPRRTDYIGYGLPGLPRSTLRR